LIGLCLGTGALSGWLTRDAITGWYHTLRKPPLNPPNWVFGPVWGLLYVITTVAAWLIWCERSAGTGALEIFLVQLALNFLWSILFFRLQSPAAALCDLILLWIAIAATIVAFSAIVPLAGAILIPYIAWVSFAGYLNGGVWWLNSRAAPATQ